MKDAGAIITPFYKGGNWGTARKLVVRRPGVDFHSLTSHDVTLDKSLPLPRPQFSHLWNLQIVQGHRYSLNILLFLEHISLKLKAYIKKEWARNTPASIGHACVCTHTRVCACVYVCVKACMCFKSQLINNLFNSFFPSWAQQNGSHKKQWQEEGPFCHREIMTREYTISVHKHIHGVGFQKCVSQVCKYTLTQAKGIRGFPIV